MIVKDNLITLLETFEIPVILQGTLAPDESFPDDFITFETVDSDTPQAFDNDDGVTVWTFNVNYYSNNPDKVANVPGEIRRTLKAAGFIPQGKGNDLITNEPNFTGWAMEFQFIESEV
jgi:hypothetical protein